MARSGSTHQHGRCGLAVAVLLAITGCSSLASSLLTETDLAALHQKLSDERAWVRERAAIRLGDLGSRDSIGPLAAVALGDPDPLVRVRAVEALGRSGSPGAVPTLTKALTDAEPDVQVSALSALAALDARGAAADVAALMASESLLVRGAAAATHRELTQR